MRIWILIALGFSQTIAQTLSFDVASVKPSPPPAPGGRRMAFGGVRGGPGTNDPGRVEFPFTTVKNLLITAYSVKDYQVSGPAWMSTERYEVQATMPPETTKEQFHTMLQNLLAERFKIVLHRETKELPMYTLLVAKGGPKMKESAEVPAAEKPKEDPPPRPGGRGPMKIGPDGFPAAPAGLGSYMIMMPYGARMGGSSQTMKEFSNQLSNILAKPVTDATELSGKYDFTLTYSMEGLNGGITMMAPPPPGAGGGRGAPELPENAEPLQTLFAAIQSQLGLKLEPKKGPVEILIVDRAEKTPTEN